MCTIFINRGLIKGGNRVSFESDLSREARRKADNANSIRKKNKKAGGNQGQGGQYGGGNGLKVNPNAPKGKFIGNSGKRLWVKGRYLSGEKSLNKTQRNAAKEENAKTGYQLPLYASTCVLVRWGPVPPHFIVSAQLHRQERVRAGECGFSPPHFALPLYRKCTSHPNLCRAHT